MGGCGELQNLDDLAAVSCGISQADPWNLAKFSAKKFGGTNYYRQTENNILVNKYTHNENKTLSQHTDYIFLITSSRKLLLT